MNATIALLTLLSFPLLAGEPTAPAEAPKTEAPKAAAKPAAGPSEDEGILYTLGFLLGRNLGPFNLTATDLKPVTAGLKDSAAGKKPSYDLQTYGPKIDEWVAKRQAKGAEKEKAKSKEFLAKMAKEKDAVVSPTGMIFIPLKEGDGASPSSTDTVKAHYEGKLVDGTKFDSSYDRGEPTEFGLNRVIRCWTEGIPKMKVGGKAKLVCPSDIAYGDSGNGRIPPGATLIFTVELVSIVK